MCKRYVFPCAVLLLLASCGGGGGGSGQTVDPPDPIPILPGALTGEISVFLPVEESVLETEPNGTQLQAHYLGEMANGRTVHVVGHAAAGGDDDAALDAFSILATERTRLEVSLSFDSVASPDMFLGLWDLTVQQYVEVFQAQQSPMSAVLHVKGLCALVVYASAGEANYILTVAAHSAGQIPEQEPNGNFYGTQFVGEVLLGDTVVVLGEAQSATDDFDGVTVVVPEAVTLDTAVGIVPTGFPQNAELDVLVYDVTGGESDPPLLAYFTWGVAGPGIARGSVPIAAGSIIRVFVFAFTGTAKWSMAIRGLAPTAQAAASAVPAGRGRPQPPADALQVPDFEPGPEFVPGQALVRLAAGACAPEGCCAKGSVPNVCTTLGFEMPQGLTPAEQRRFTLRTIACLQRRGDVAHAEPNYIRRALREPSDTFYNLQWHYPQLRLPEAWDITVGDPGVIVAVIDTGTTAHPELTPREVPGYDFISDPDRAVDGGGPDSDPTDPGDGAPGFASSFHGTHVAGTVGATSDNGVGVAGVTWQGGLMHLRVLGRFGGEDADIANAILFAAGLPNSSGTVPANRAHVINLSLGGFGFSQTTADAVASARAAGVVVVAASGNENTTAPFYPASYDGVISVGSVDLAGVRAPYSNYGPTLDVMAPGGDTGADRNLDGWPDGVLSTWVYDDESLFWFLDGTSMAAPHVAGVVALMLAVNPDLTPAEVEQILKATASDLGTAGVDAEYGHGLVDAYAAVFTAQAAGVPPTPPALALSTTGLGFNRTETEKRIRVSNTGGGILDVDPPTIFLGPGETWLQATLVPGAGLSSDTSAIDVTVDRTGLADGIYFGRILVESNGGAQLVIVLARVQAAAPSPPSINIIVRAIDLSDGSVAKQVVVNPASLDLTFRLDDLAPGDYRLEAGTDADADGQLCEPGELCGAYPVVEYAIVITVRAGEELGPFKFTVTPSGIVPAGD